MVVPTAPAGRARVLDMAARQRNCPYLTVPRSQRGVAVYTDSAATHSVTCNPPASADQYIAASIRFDSENHSVQLHSTET